MEADNTLIGKIADKTNKSVQTSKRWVVLNLDKLQQIEVLNVIVEHYELEGVNELENDKNAA